ncbi:MULTISPECIES: LysM peptidoglycan-binding domain-containing protein [unclassified Ruegeria]|uniref:LysM peptidoglycan-binding domain-containing protein n=1 Tax=unclassified Ruegeria TaxID=2625375 RepID=UPI001AE1B14A|nr:MULTISPECIES: LysM peptidoglycan-binding domain-containing protein [unclassified Ruegeria]
MDAKSGNGSSGNFVWGVIAGLVAVLGVGGLYLSGAFTKAPEPEAGAPQEPASVATTQPQEQAAEAPAETATTEPAEQATVTPDEAPTAEPVEDTAAATDVVPDSEPAVAQSEENAPARTAPPVLDQIFVEADGTALLSGDAEPGSQIEVLLNGETVHTFTVDSSGQFAEFVSIPFSDNAQGLILHSKNGAQTTRSDDYLIAALPKPVEEEPVAQQTDAADQGETTKAEEQIASAVVDPETETPVETETPDPVATAPETSEAQVADQSAETSETGQQIAVLRSGEEGVELVQPPVVRDTPPEQVALDTIGYSETGDVQLTGRVQDGAAIRVYLDNRLVADLAPEQDGSWRSDLDGIDPGVYTLRVDAVNTDGTVRSRVETPFKREPVEVLEAATGGGDGTAGQDNAPAIRSVTVQRGDTLWAISRDRFGDGILYVRLFEANRDLIRDPDLIYPGQIFTIPE